MALFNDTGSYTWTISKKLSSYKVGDKLVSDIFGIAIENLKCQMKIYPNGSKDDFEGYAMVFCKIVCMPDNWKTITICKTVSSPQTKSKQTNMGQYRIGINQGWKYVLPFAEIKDLNFLELIISIRILRIEMKNSIIHYPNDNFEYEKQMNLQYILSSSDILLLKHCKMGKMVESSIFNLMWCIRLCPNGCTPRDAGKCALGLTLCGLPKDISKIKTRWSIQCEEMNIHSTQISDFSVDSTTKGCNIGTFKQFKCLNELCINIHVQIIKEYDNNNKKIQIKYTESKRELCDSISDSNKSINENNKSPINDINEFKMNVLQQKLIKYDEMFENININMDKMNNKISKLAELLTKSLKLNKQNDIEIKKLKNKLDELFDDECKRDTNFKINNDIKQQINALKKAVTQLEINRNSNSRSDNSLTDKEKLKLFLQNDVKLNDDALYDSFIDNGFESIESLYDLVMDDLKEIGISKLYHRKQLLKAIQKEKYKNRQSFSVQSHTKPTITNAHTVEGSISDYQSYCQ